MKTINMLLIAAFSMLSFTAFSQEKAGKKDTTSHISYYSCPMHDSVHLAKEGYCPICGMKLQLSKKEQLKSGTVKNYTCPMHPSVKSATHGKCPQCGSTLVSSLTPKEKLKMKVTKIYTCPMHGDITSDKPSKCSRCGMDLVQQKGN